MRAGEWFFRFFFVGQIAHVAAAAAGGRLLGEKEVIDLSQKNDPYDDPDDDDDKKLQVHIN
jgi:hypothetical protein